MKQLLKKTKWVRLPLRVFRTYCRRLLAIPAYLNCPLFTRQKQFMPYKNLHAGKTAFLIGNGPSVRLEDLEKLQDEITFCCNKFYLAYSRTSFRPMYTVSGDTQMIEDFGQDIVNQSSGQVFIVSGSQPSLKGNYIWVPMAGGKIRLNPNIVFSEIVHTGATVLAALQIGYAMGIRKFILYGIDHNFSFQQLDREKDKARAAQGEGNHFIANYREGKPWAPPQTNLIEQSFIQMDQLLRKEGGYIKNATIGGYLNVLERTNLLSE